MKTPLPDWTVRLWFVKSMSSETPNGITRTELFCTIRLVIMIEEMAI